MNKYNFPLSIVLAFLIFALHTTTFAIETESQHPYVKTVQLYTAGQEGIVSEHGKEVLHTPLLYLNSTYALFLEFDWLGEELLDQFYFKVFHCTKDWEKTNVLETAYLEEVNDFFSNEVTISNTIGVQYVHCKAKLPTPTLSGNYLLYVYSDSEEQVLLTRKFAIVESRINITIDQNISNISSKKQGFDFTVRFGNSFPFDFQDFTTVYARKNFCWHTMKKIENPTMVNLNAKTISYTSNFSNISFEAGNEYISFDAGSDRSLGINTKTIQRNRDTLFYHLYPYKPFPLLYKKYFDINGQYLIHNYFLEETNVSSEYVKAVFTLDYSLPPKGKAYVFGAFNNWALTEENRLKYQVEQRNYQAVIWLKQGYYDLNYVWQDEKGNLKETYFSGSFNQTENQYELLVYYYDQNLQIDRILGYTKFQLP